MLIEFSVGNYKSFRDVETFSMVATKIKAKDSEVDENNTFKIDDDLSLLKSAAIYGANASGKSNFAKALGFMKRFVVESSKETQTTDQITVEAYQLTSTETIEPNPSFFQIVFLLNNITYRYGFETTDKEIISEWLFFTPNVKETKLFERRDGEIVPSPKFKEGKSIVEKTRTNALFLSVVAQFNGAISQEIIRWFLNINIISGLDDSTMDFTSVCLHSRNLVNEISSFIKKLDLGIQDISVFDEKLTKDSLPIGMPERVKTAIIEESGGIRFKVMIALKKFNLDGKHAGTEFFDLQKNASEGTKKLFSLAGPLMDTLKKGKILFIDEFDARLHPLITREIIKLFNSNETNSKNAQIIFATHDTNLLTNKLFRRDQIWFVEKDKTGSTHLYSLAEYKVRNDASFENDYIQGRYGAVPFIGDLKPLFEVPNTVEETNA